MNNTKIKYSKACPCGSQYAYIECCFEYSLDFQHLKQKYAADFNRALRVTNDENGSKEAIRIYNKIIKNIPDDWEAIANRGVAKSRIGNIGGAINDYLEAIKKSPIAEPQLFCNLGNELERNGDLEEAFNAYEQALKWQPHHPFSKFNFSRIKGLMGDHEGMKNDLHESFHVFVNKLNIFSLNQLYAKERWDHPQLYYTYRPINSYVIDELQNNYIHTSDPRMFNDPFDCPIFKDADEQYVDGYDIRNKIKVRSFCHIGMSFGDVEDIPVELDNILLWSHYADNHKGLAVGYRFDEYFYKGQKDMCLAPVYYNKHVPNDPTQLFYELGLLTKLDIWQYENEHRLICLNKEGNEQEGFRVPLNDWIVIESITFGLCTSIDDKKRIYDRLSGSNKRGVQFYEIYNGGHDRYSLMRRKISF